MEIIQKRYRKPENDDTQDGAATRQHDTCIFRNF